MDAEAGLCLCFSHTIKSVPSDKAHIVYDSIHDLIWQNIKKD